MGSLCHQYLLKNTMSTFSFILKLGSILYSAAIDLICLYALIVALASAQNEPYKQAQAFFLFVIATSVNKVTIEDKS